MTALASTSSARLNVAELLEIVESQWPEVVVLDVRMPPTFTTEGLDAALRIRSITLEIGILVLSQYVETRHAIRLITSGTDGVGYLLKDRVADLGELIVAISGGRRRIRRRHRGRAQLLGRPRPAARSMS